MKVIEVNPFAPIKVLMLDFDGVLNSSNHLRKRATAIDGAPFGSQAHEDASLDEESIQRLNIIVEPDDVVVVVSSTWRHGKMRADLQNMLTRNGFTGLVIGKTPWLCKPRGLEVKAWLTDTRRNVVSFAIIDDDDDFDEFGRDRLVQTSFSGGLLDEHVDKVRQVLARPWKGLAR